MNKLTLLLGGIAVGVLVLFAVIGVKSTLFKPGQPDTQASALGENGWQPPPVTPSSDAASGDEALPVQTAPVDGDMSASQADTPDTNGEDVEGKDLELVDEPGDNTSNSAQTVKEDETDTTENPVDGADENTEPQTPAPPATRNGKLEIVIQAGADGTAVKANVYVQKANGVHVAKSDYTSKASFNLEPGTYRVTAKAAGRSDTVRDIKVPEGATVSQFFALPATVAAPPTNLSPPPQVQEPTQQEPEPQPGRSGRLRLVALDADTGVPLRVDFTISRLDGSVLKQINNVEMAEVELPTQEFVVRFNYQGREGYKSLRVRRNQVRTHTFNIQTGPQHGAHMNPPPVQPMQAPPLQQRQPPPGTVEDMMMQRLQEEVQKHLTN